MLAGGGHGMGFADAGAVVTKMMNEIRLFFFI